MDANNSTAWVDSQLAALNPTEAWEPDVAAAFARFRTAREGRTWPLGRWTVTVAGAACLALWLLILPSGRALAHKCLECSVAVWQYTLSVSSSELPTGASAGLVPAAGRKLAPNFDLQDENGQYVSLASLRGKVVLLNFWATWCHGCQIEIPWFIEFQKKYADKAFEVLGVSMDDDGWKAVKPWIIAKGVNYPIVIGNKQLGDAYALSGMPHTVLIDRQGRIADVQLGVVKRATTEQRIRALLGDLQLELK
jgi:peroxiredoxin